jgi:hypothetical protein
MALSSRQIAAGKICSYCPPSWLKENQQKLLLKTTGVKTRDEGHVALLNNQKSQKCWIDNTEVFFVYGTILYSM